MTKLLVRFVLIAIICLLTISLTACDWNIIGMLNPKGIIANEERRLFFDTLALMLIVVLPVIVMSLAFIFHYQVSHRTKDYKPNWSHDIFLETLWWGIPLMIIFVLAILTWKKTYELDPFNPIPSNRPPLIIQAFALPWKWLFIYPDQGVAAVNYLEIPINEPVEFWITTDNVPMSSFFIPQIGSQIFTMAGMRSRLFLLANKPGIFDGMNTQFNGDGFSEMHFEVHVVEANEMQLWFTQLKSFPDILDETAYKQLLNPTIADKPKFFSGASKDLFNEVVELYMHSTGRVHPRESQLKAYNMIDEHG